MTLSARASTLGGMIRPIIQYRWRTSCSHLSCCHAPSQQRSLFNYIVCPEKHGAGYLKSESVRCVQVDKEFELHRLLGRKVGGFCALEYLVDISGGTTIEIGYVRS